MENRKNNKTIPRNLAIVLILVVALAGGIAFTVENMQKKELLAASEHAMLNQQSHIMAVYDQIESNLASIREHENMINKGFTGPEETGDMLPEERIQKEIDYIKYMIDENNKLIESLNDQIGNRDSRIAGYERTVKDFQARVATYQQQVDQLVAERNLLQNDLENTIMVKNNLATQVEQLGTEVVQKDNTIHEQQVQLINKDNTLQHCILHRRNLYKTLRDNNVLQKEGGFLGINRVTTLVGAPDKELFQTIDTRDIA
jgi:peptidoglycan hydrolase CwlO-like protein